MAGVYIFKDPINIWKDQGGWVTYDLSFYLPADAVGVILWAQCRDTIDTGFAVRPYGSSYDHRASLYSYGGPGFTYIISKVSNDKKIEVWQGDLAHSIHHQIQLVGYLGPEFVLYDIPIRYDYPEGLTDINIDFSQNIPSSAKSVVIGFYNYGLGWAFYSYYLWYFGIQNWNFKPSASYLGSGHVGSYIFPVGNKIFVRHQDGGNKGPGSIEILGYSNEYEPFSSPIEIFNGRVNGWVDIQTGYPEGTALHLRAAGESDDYSYCITLEEIIRRKGSNWWPLLVNDQARRLGHWDNFVAVGQDGKIEHYQTSNKTPLLCLYVLGLGEVVVPPRPPRPYNIEDQNPAIIVFSAPILESPKRVDIANPAIIKFTAPTLTAPTGYPSGEDPSPGLYRIYFENGIWKLDPNRLETSGLKLSWNTNGIADTLSCTITKNGERVQTGDRLWWQDPDGYHWGGLVQNITEKRGGVYELQGIGFWQLIREIEAQDNYNRVFDWAIIQDILNQQMGPLPVTLEYDNSQWHWLSNFPIKGKKLEEILNHFCIRYNYSYWIRQAHWWQSPILYYYPVSSEIGGVLDIADIQAGWRKEEDISQVVNKIIAEGETPDYTGPSGSNLAEDTIKTATGETVYGIGGINYFGHLSWFTIDNGAKHIGIYTVLAKPITVKKMRIIVSATSPPPSYFQLNIKDGSGNTHGPYIISISDTGGNITFSTPIQLPAGNTYFDFCAPDASESCYVMLACDIAPPEPRGIKGTLSQLGNWIWNSGTAVSEGQLDVAFWGPDDPSFQAGVNIFVPHPNIFSYHSASNGGFELWTFDVVNNPCIYFIANLPASQFEKIKISHGGGGPILFVAKQLNGWYATKTLQPGMDYELPIDSNIGWDSYIGTPGTIDWLEFHPTTSEPSWIKTFQIIGKAYAYNFQDDESINHFRFISTEKLDTSLFDDVNDIANYVQNFLAKHAFPPPAISVSTKNRISLDLLGKKIQMSFSDNQTYEAALIGITHYFANRTSELTFDTYSVNNLTAVLAAIGKK